MALDCLAVGTGGAHSREYDEDTHCQFCGAVAPREHGKTCRCADCRHDRFNPGPPSMTKRQMRDRAHAEALIEDEERERAKRSAA